MDPISTPPTQPLIQPAPIEPKKSNSKMLIIFIVILILIAGLAFAFLMPKTNNLNDNQKLTPSPAINTSAPQTDEEKEVDKIDVTDTTSTELMEVEKDINNL